MEKTVQEHLRAELSHTAWNISKSVRCSVNAPLTFVRFLLLRFVSFCHVCRLVAIPSLIGELHNDSAYIYPCTLTKIIQLSSYIVPHCHLFAPNGQRSICEIRNCRRRWGMCSVNSFWSRWRFTELLGCVTLKPLCSLMNNSRWEQSDLLQLNPKRGNMKGTHVASQLQDEDGFQALRRRLERPFRFIVFSHPHPGTFRVH